MANERTDERIVTGQTSAVTDIRGAEHPPSIYTASKTKHAHKWRALREQGFNVISTWIDEAGLGESESLEDLAHRCISEASGADLFILYCEPGDVLKGALMELGAALASHAEIYVVGECDSLRSAVMEHSRIRRMMRVEDALNRAGLIPAEPLPL